MGLFVVFGRFVGGLVQVAAFPALAAAMDDGHLFVGSEFGLTVTQDTLGKSRGMAEFLIKVIVITTFLVAVVHLGHQAAVTSDFGTALTFFLADERLLVAARAVALEASATTAVIITVRATTIVIKASAGTVTVFTPGAVTLKASTRTFLTSHLIVVALAALTGTEALVADVLTALP